ncbi:flagellar hook protein FlgE [Buchnera aphidicola]|uniref:Flagellar hook protein FlgE n=1 Tax=Buchnera aphidicola subsp. Uroleucon sonchi TaxID=118118 RepID=A0A6C1FAX5_BUCUN|nr:flagellar hook protein FlgE [Buchnera aphidicola]QIE02048.1 flagellar hook-basal body complex protein [Buchnera aphidicola (Uroleucon sonchi)]
MSESANGLRVINDSLVLTSSNIANTSTIGYKSSKPVFFDIFSTSVYSKNPVANGVSILRNIQDFSNGTLISTNRDLDIGIANEGFFRVLDSKGDIHYTRNGQFILDNNKNIVNMQGMYLTGYNQKHVNNVFDTSNIEKINLKNAYKLECKPTTEIKFQAYLNSQMNKISNTNNSNDSSADLEAYTNSINIYKKNGEKEKIDISFSKLENNKWQVHVKSNNPDNEAGIDQNFELKFSPNGELTSDSIMNIKSNNSQYSNIKLDLTGTVETKETNNNFEQPSQNGYSRSKLKYFTISPNGEIIGAYENQQNKIIGQILLSKFISPENLRPETGNLWSATAETGTEIIGIAGQSGFGTLVSRSLEMSNVDLNKELINMIVQQRNYQSNVQSFKAEDKMINTLINLR